LFNASAGTHEFVKRWDPKPGDIVSFKHHGYLMATKKPKLPTLYRLRTDVTWDDVQANWKEQKAAPLGKIFILLNWCIHIFSFFEYFFL